MKRIIIPEGEKGYQCEVLLDSVSPSGARLTTMRWKYPLMVHAEGCRHRCQSRAVGSSRAIPTARMIASVVQDCATPVFWGKNQKGMAAAEELTGWRRRLCEGLWRGASYGAVAATWSLTALGLHKQIANRPLTPFLYVTEVVTATDWANFFALRCHPAAQPEMRKIADLAHLLYLTSTPRTIRLHEWHLPFVTNEEAARLGLENAKKMSAARVARTSYRTHEGKRSTLEEDRTLYTRLVGAQPIHASPTEHLATPLPHYAKHLPHPYVGNLRGWQSHRYELEGHTITDT
jgi:hypothetical protein